MAIKVLKQENENLRRDQHADRIEHAQLVRENVSLKAQNAQQRKRGEGVETLERDCDEYRSLAKDAREEAKEYHDRVDTMKDRVKGLEKVNDSERMCLS